MHRLNDVCEKLRKVITSQMNLQEKSKPDPLQWDGPLFSRIEILAGSPDIQKQLTPENLKYHAEKGRDILDVVLMLAWQFGFENGVMFAEEHRDLN